MDLYHFYLLRSVGKGAFGKVSALPRWTNGGWHIRGELSSQVPLVAQVRVVQHKQTKALYALKYINKARISKQRAVNNVRRPPRSPRVAQWGIVGRTGADSLSLSPCAPS